MISNVLTSNELFQRSLKVAPGGVHSPVRAFSGMGRAPVFFASAQGAFMQSVEGNQYIDFCQSFGPNLLGHRDPDVMKEVEGAIHSAWSFAACEPYSLELAEFLVQEVPGLEKLRFVNSGTEAVMSALRVARAATGREKVLKFDGCYHGHVDHMLVQAGSGLAGETASSSAGVTSSMSSHTLVARLDDIESVEAVFKQHGNEISAVILEPLPANFGLLVQRQEFWQQVFQVARQYGALIIFDEVISGFRVDLGGMAKLMEFKPDLFTFGKVMGGGFPVGCYGGRADLMDMVAPLGKVYQAGTLSGNPVGMRAGLATLKKVKHHQVHATLQARTEKFAQQLQNVFTQYDYPMQIEQFSSLFWFHEATMSPIRRPDQIPSGHAEKFKPFFNYLLDHGVYLAPNAFEVGFISLAHTDEILQQVVETVESYVESYVKDQGR